MAGTPTEAIELPRTGSLPVLHEDPDWGSLLTTAPAPRSATRPAPRQTDRFLVVLRAVAITVGLLGGIYTAAWVSSFDADHEGAVFKLDTRPTSPSAVTPTKRPEPIPTPEPSPAAPGDPINP